MQTGVLIFKSDGSAAISAIAKFCGPPELELFASWPGKAAELLEIPDKPACPRLRGFDHIPRSINSLSSAGYFYKHAAESAEFMHPSATSSVHYSCSIAVPDTMAWHLIIRRSDHTPHVQRFDYILKHREVRTGNMVSSLQIGASKNGCKPR